MITDTWGKLYEHPAYLDGALFGGVFISNTLNPYGYSAQSAELTAFVTRATGDRAKLQAYVSPVSAIRAQTGVQVR